MSGKKRIQQRPRLGKCEVCKRRRDDIQRVDGKRMCQDCLSTKVIIQ